MTQNDSQDLGHQKQSPGGLCVVGDFSHGVRGRGWCSDAHAGPPSPGPLGWVAQEGVSLCCHWCLRTLTPWGLTPAKRAASQGPALVSRELWMVPACQAAPVPLGSVRWAELADTGSARDWVSQYPHPGLSMLSSPVFAKS